MLNARVCHRIDMYEMTEDILDSITVDYVCGTRDELIRRAKLVPWTEDDLSEDVDYQQIEPNEQYFNVKFSILFYLILSFCFLRFRPDVIMKVFHHRTIIQ